MNTQKILESEIRDLKIASLPRRPTSPTAYGGEGYTAQDMKAAFDRLPLFLVERLNSLINDIEREDDGKISESIKTGLFELHTLADFFADVKNGSFASYLTVGDVSLVEAISDLRAQVESLKATMGITG